MKYTLLLLIQFYSILGSCQTYNIDKFELELEIYKKLNTTAGILTKAYLNNNINGYSNDSLNIKTDRSDTNTFFQNDNPQGFMLFYSNKRDFDKAEMNYKLSAVCPLIPTTWYGIKMGDRIQSFIPINEVEKVCTNSDLNLLKLTGSLLFNTYSGYLTKNLNDTLNYSLDGDINDFLSTQISNNISKTSHIVRLDRMYINQLHPFIVNQISGSLNKMIHNDGIKIFKDSSLHFKYTPEESKEFMYFKDPNPSFVKFSLDPSMVDTVYYKSTEESLIFVGVKQIIFTEKSVGFRLNEQVFYISNLFIESQPEWFRLLCNVWSRYNKP